jgi:hypothetical protein
MTDRPTPTVDIEDLPFGQEPAGYCAPSVGATVHDSIPSRLAAMEPGPVLAAYLESLDIENLSAHDLVVVLSANQRMVSYHSGAMYTNMVALQTSMLTFDGYEQPFEYAAASAVAEVRTALHLTARSADIEMAFALSLHERLPRLASMLGSGSIDMRRARTIERGTIHLPDDVARRVVDAVADKAPMMTTGQIRAEVRRLCIEVDPDDAAQRYDRSVQDRRVVAEPTDAGTANLLALDLPPDRVTAVTALIHEIALSLNTAYETRTMDQLRADVYLDLLEGRIILGADGSTPAGGGTVDIICDLKTLAALADHPGNLAGYGPVIADIARRIAKENTDGEWRFTCTDDAGTPMHVGTTSRRPTAGQRRRIEARHRTCVFPGCRAPSRTCDIDHTLAVADGGKTCDCNLAPLCRHDHRLKHMSGWNYVVDADGSITWTTPSGHAYIVTPRSTPP